jgi:hypothetical protein
VVACEPGQKEVCTQDWMVACNFRQANMGSESQGSIGAENHTNFPLLWDQTEVS